MASNHQEGEPGKTGDITRLLVAWSEGDMQAFDAVFPLAFEDLRRIARRCFHRFPASDLQPTELIGEIYATLLKQHSIRWENRGQFYKFAAFLMERFLMSYQRSISTTKRGGDTLQVPILEALDLASSGDMSSGAVAVQPSSRPDEVASIIGSAVDIAGKIAKLAELDPEQAEIVRMRYLIGLTMEETAETLNLSLSTAKRRWRHAKRFLTLELGEYGSE